MARLEQRPLLGLSPLPRGGCPGPHKGLPVPLHSWGRACGLLAVLVRALYLGPLFPRTVQGCTKTAEVKRGFALLGRRPHPRVWDGFVFIVWLGGEGPPRGSHRRCPAPCEIPPGKAGRE